MTTDINKLLERLRTYYGDDLACRTLLMDARHALEALAGEVVDLKKRLDIAQRWPTFSSAREAAEAAEAERDRLKAALQPFSDAYERLVRTQESMGFSDNATFGLGIKVSAIKVARKVLGGDA